MRSYVKKSYLTSKEKINLLLMYFLATILNSFSEITLGHFWENQAIVESFQYLKKYEILVIFISIAMVVVANVKITSKNSNRIIPRILSGATVRSIKTSYIKDSLLIASVPIVTIFCLEYSNLVWWGCCKIAFMLLVIVSTVGMRSRKVNVK